MSGSTIVNRRGETFEIRLETPCISFMRNPDGTNPEQAFHARARRRFEAQIDRLWPHLPALVAAAAADAGLEIAPLREVSCQVPIPEGWIRVGLVRGADDAARMRLRAGIEAGIEATRPPTQPAEPEPPPAPRGWRRWFE